MREIDLKYQTEKGETVFFIFDVKEHKRCVEGKLLMSNYRVNFII